MARHPNRPTSLDYISRFDRFDELHGDRHFRDDPAIVGGFAILRSRPVMVIGQQRGRDTKENLRRNFGMPAPEGYRKATRLAKLGVAIASADRDVRRYQRRRSGHQLRRARAIGGDRGLPASLYDGAVPIVATIIGEGGSGGALALAIADHVIMLEHSTYSVASPEGCAAILWSDAGKAEEAARG